eukprot:7457853-Pyramimonas_sp.AAC.1
MEAFYWSQKITKQENDSRERSPSSVHTGPTVMSLLVSEKADYFNEKYSGLLTADLPLLSGALDTLRAECERLHSAGLELFVSIVIQGAAQWKVRVMDVVDEWPYKIFHMLTTPPDDMCDRRKELALEWLGKERHDLAS